MDNAGKLLDSIRFPADIRQLKEEELPRLADEVREEIVDTISKIGGHFASGLGTVELTIALHYLFDTPRDQIVWDVGHQTYTHKILTGRRDRFATIRQRGGLSGFTSRSESEYDAFNAAHASTSISAALGMAVARDAKGEDFEVVAVIGDGGLTGGMAMEGLNQAGYLRRKLIVVLNDNEMSISPNVGALCGYLNTLVTGQRYIKVKEEVEKLLKKSPLFAKEMIKAAKMAEDTVKHLFIPGHLFEELGFKYSGPINGHSIHQLLAALREAKGHDRPTLVHIVTTKGKGYKLAESDPVYWHGPSPFVPATGEVRKKPAAGPPAYTNVFAQTMIEMAERDPAIVCVTAAMLEGTGLDAFKKRFPERTFDVGIAEQHAVTFCAGMATQGMKPVAAIYSTFLHRALDQVFHDVCLMDLPVVFCMDRAGLVGNDGPTHHGLYDMTYMRMWPNMIAMAPKDENELRHMLATALTTGHPTCVRYARGAGYGVPFDADFEILPIGKGEVLRHGSDGVLWAIGHRVIPALRAAERLAAQEGLDLTVVNARFLKPLDASLIAATVPAGGRVVTVEDNVLAGGFGSAVMETVSDLRIPGVEFLRLGVPDRPVQHASQDQQWQEVGLDEDGIYRQTLAFFRATAAVALRDVSKAG